jgi:hypothetical protein
MTTPGLQTSIPHTIVSLGPPRPLSTESTESCTQTVNSSGYGYGCVSSPTCASPMVLSTDTATSLYGVPLLMCISPTSGSVQPGGPMSSASLTAMSVTPGGPMSSATVTSSSNPGGLMSSATVSPSSSPSVQPGGPRSSSGISPSGIASASLQHTSLTSPLSTGTELTTTSGTSTGTSTSSSVTTTASGSGAVGMNANLAEPSLVGFLALCWLGVWGWRTLRGQL